jgi:hypothetical protein
MKTRNWEDWMFGASLIAAVAAGLALSEVRAPSFTSEAIAAEEAAGVQYVMTVTARRLPAECKGVPEAKMSPNCLAIVYGATDSMRRIR